LSYLKVASSWQWQVHQARKFYGACRRADIILPAPSPREILQQVEHALARLTRPLRFQRHVASVLTDTFKVLDISSTEAD
jgi:hypothetical protein